MLDQNTRNLLYKVSRAYYEEGLTQKQIGKRFGISRIKVSRLLNQARACKVVQISVTAVDDSRAELEHELEKRYGLDEVITVVPPNYSSNEITRALGPAAAEVVVRGLQGKEIIAISWGSTLCSVVDALAAQNWPEARIVQSLGGLSSPEAEIHGADLARRMANALGAKPLLLSSPGIVTNKAVGDALRADPQVEKVLAIAARADIALVGLGVLTPGSVLLQNQILTPVEIDRLKSKGAVGDVGVRFFNKHGEPIKDELNERIIGLDLEQIKKIRRVIGVAGGTEKMDVIRASLVGRLIKVLITDDRTAERLLEP